MAQGGSPPVVVAISSTDAGRAALGRLLRARDYRVRTALPDGQAARVLAAHRPDAIVLDADPQHAAVAALLRRLAAAAPRVPVIRLDGTGRRSAAAEADLLLPSPVSGRMLRRAVRAALRLRRAEAQAARARWECEAAFGAIAHGVCLLDAKGQVLRHNPAMASLLGCSEQALSDRPVWQARGRGRPLPLARLFRQLRRDRQRQAGAVAVGRRRLEITLDPVFGECGQLVAATMTAADVTEHVRARRRAERAGGARAREARLLDTILENTTNAVAYLDPEFRFVRVNSLAASVAGITPAEMTGCALLEVFPRLVDLQAAMRRAMTTKRPVEIRQFEWLPPGHPERGPRAVDVALVPVLTEEGEVEGLVASALDVTERVQEHEQLLAAERARAALAENLKDEIAHRVRDHLAMVTGLLQVQVATQADDRVCAALRGAVSRIRTIGELHDVMYAPQGERVALGAILQRVAEGAREVFAGGEPVELLVAGHQLVCSPAQATNVSVIVHELVANAVRHGGPGPDGRRRVQLRTSRRGGELRLSVWGSGHPLPKDFDIQAQQGTGLRVVSDLVSQYGGLLTLRPRAGGTEAVVKLEAERLT
jgi:PAS domain S-box-containing protein